MMRCALALTLALAAATAATAQQAPEPLKLPLTVFEVNYNGETLGLPPRAATKAELEARATLPWEQWLPLRTYLWLGYLTRTRVCSVVKEACGLKDQPVLFTFEENLQPHYGPELFYETPYALAVRGKLWRLSLDVAKGNVTISGGVHLWDVGSVEFFEDGALKANGVEICRYAANVPIHLDILVDVEKKIATYTVDGKTADAVTVPWVQPKSPAFGTFILHGLLPGGHAQAPSSLAFDNLKLVMLEEKPQ